MRGATLLVAAALLAMLIASRLRAAVRNQPPAAPLEIDRQRGEVRITGTVHPDALVPTSRGDQQHAVARAGTGDSARSLFVAQVDDGDLRAALTNLTDRLPIEISVRWAGSGGSVPLRELLAAAGTAEVSLDFRRRDRSDTTTPADDLASGCLVCLHSCPGAAVINHADVIYSAVEARLPPAGTLVTLILKSTMEAT